MLRHRCLRRQTAPRPEPDVIVARLEATNEPSPNQRLDHRVLDRLAALVQKAGPARDTIREPPSST